MIYELLKIFPLYLVLLGTENFYSVSLGCLKDIFFSIWNLSRFSSLVSPITIKSGVVVKAL